jgi:hypothetical protein
MNLPIILDIAIGLIFIYLVLSLVASEIQELISTLLQWRAKHLQKSIESLLSGGSEPRDTDEIDKARTLVKELYNDPLINTLNHEAKGTVERGFRGFFQRSVNDDKIAERQSAPSYINSETFATTLMQVLKIPDLVKKMGSNGEEIQADLNIVLSSYHELKTAIQNPNSQGYQALKNIYGDIDDELIKIINSLPDYVPDSVINSLSILAKRSQSKVGKLGEELNQFKKEVEVWFNRSMERGSGVYKRNAKGVALLIGLAIAASTNTDTFHVISRLSRDSALRTAITQSASQREQLYSDPSVKIQVVQALEDVALPIGWTASNLNQQLELKDFTGWNSLNFFLLKSWQVLRMLTGWILSGLAIAMGAPFWFDLLGKVINVRNTGPKPASSTEK